MQEACVSKIGVRTATLNRRAAMSPAARATAAGLVTEALTAAVRTADRVAAYVSFGTEPATAELLSLREDILLPVLLADGSLEWAVAERLQPGRRGMLEPSGARQGTAALAGCDLVLVPAVAVDGRGMRLGRGGGSYDRALPGCTGLTVALLYDGELHERLPAEPHDVAVRAVATPTGGLVQLSG